MTLRGTNLHQTQAINLESISFRRSRTQKFQSEDKEHLHKSLPSIITTKYKQSMISENSMISTRLLGARFQAELIEFETILSETRHDFQNEMERGWRDCSYQSIYHARREYSCPTLCEYKKWNKNQFQCQLNHDHRINIVPHTSERFFSHGLDRFSVKIMNPADNTPPKR